MKISLVFILQLLKFFILKKFYLINLIEKLREQSTKYNNRFYFILDHQGNPSYLKPKTKVTVLKATRNAKTRKVRNNYLRAIQNREFLLSTMLLSIVLYRKELMVRDVNLKHEYLTSRLQAVEVNKHKLNKIWISYAQREITQGDAQGKTNDIMSSYEKEVSTTQEKIDIIATEKLIYNLLGKDKLEAYLSELIDSIG